MVFPICNENLFTEVCKSVNEDPSDVLRLAKKTAGRRSEKLKKRRWRQCKVEEEEEEDPDVVPPTPKDKTIAFGKRRNRKENRNRHLFFKKYQILTSHSTLITGKKNVHRKRCKVPTEDENDVPVLSTIKRDSLLRVSI